MNDNGIGRLDKCASDFCTGSSHGLFVRENTWLGAMKYDCAASPPFYLSRMHSIHNWPAAVAWDGQNDGRIWRWGGESPPDQPTLRPILESNQVPWVRGCV